MTTNSLNLDTLTLSRGKHDSPADGYCVMEAVSLLAGQRWSDRPNCVSRVIGGFLQTWNDWLDDAERQELKRHIPHVIGTVGTWDVETRRSFMALDWLARVNTPALLDLIPSLAPEAAALRALPELTAATVESAIPTIRHATLETIRVAKSIYSHPKFEVALKHTQGRAGNAAANAAAFAVSCAAGNVATTAAHTLELAVYWVMGTWVLDTIDSDVLTPTTAMLTASAHDLVERMIAVK